MGSWGLVPFVRILLAFLPGMILGLYLRVTPTLLSVFIVALFFLAGYLLFIKNVKKIPIYGGLFLLGLLSSGYDNTIHPIQSISDVAHNFVAVVKTSPVEKGKIIAVKLKVWKTDEPSLRQQYPLTMLAYFERHEELNLLSIGDTLWFRGQVNDVNPPSNPTEFDYQAYLKHQHIIQTIYVPKEDLLAIHQGSKGLINIAETCRDWAINRIASLDLNKDQEGIVKALLLGVKNDLTADTKQVFSNVGVMHVLAVSGLHVGIVFLVFHLIFRSITRNKLGQFFYAVIMLVGVWSFAFITGLVPSVTRAVIMFSFLILAKALKRDVNIYNSIAASAFFMLLINPNLLFDVGFQLSYCAVTGIVFFYPKIYAWFNHLPKWMDWAWSLTAVSLAAQIATLPLTLYYFHQIPMYFWLSNIIVIPAVTIVLYGSMGYLVLGFIPGVKFLMTKILTSVIGVMQFFLEHIASWPFSVLKPIYISSFTLSILLIVIISLVCYIQFEKTMFKIGVFVFLTCFYTIRLYENVLQVKQKGRVAFALQKETAMLYYEGKSGVLFHAHEIDSSEFSYKIQPHLNKLNMTDLDTILVQENMQYQWDENVLQGLMNQ